DGAVTNPPPRPSPPRGEGASQPWWALAGVLSAWSAGIVAATLLSPLVPWLVFAAVLAAVVALVHPRLALLAGLCFAAALIGALRGATAASVELPPGLAGQVVAVSGSIDDDPVDRKGARR